MTTQLASASAARGVTPRVTDVSLCVLASSSSGNCSVLRWRENGSPRACLIDAGLSPRKTKNWLRGVGSNLSQVDAIVLTHLDRDHCHVGWTGGRIPTHIMLWMHGRHLARAEVEGVYHPRVASFSGAFMLTPGVRVRTVMLSHDRLGVASFRFEFAPPDERSSGLSIGFATDLGRVTDALVECMRGVDVLAVESNYCPRLQNESERPEFLKRRIMGGRGHLSNHECLEAVERIGPREHVVLLHLSRECNHPSLVRDLHARARYRVTIAHPDKPTKWIAPTPRRGELAAEPWRPLPAAGPAVGQPSLWESLAAS